MTRVDVAEADRPPNGTIAPDVRARLEPERESMVDLLGDLVRLESPTDDPECLALLADRLEELFEPFGRIARYPTGPNGAPHLVITVDGAEPTLPHAVVIGHFDTVWPKGTLARMPFAVDDTGIARGPGCFDMKGGLVLLHAALEELRAMGRPPRRRLRMLFNCDEEIGSPTSRRLIDTVAAGATFGFVLEPPLPGGALKTARKGSMIYRLEIEGRAAHAGIEPEKGASAVLELASQIQAVHTLHAPEEGTLVNVGVVRGGSRLNVVPASAEADIAVRIATAEAAERVDAAMRALQPVLDGTKVRVVPGRSRPPMQPTPESRQLFAMAQAIAASMGADLGEGATGGGSDANLLAAKGIPTLDGLGPDGGGAHAEDEHVITASMPWRAAMLAGLLAEV